MAGFHVRRQHVARDRFGAVRARVAIVGHEHRGPDPREHFAGEDFIERRADVDPGIAFFVRVVGCGMGLEGSAPAFEAAPRSRPILF